MTKRILFLGAAPSQIPPIEYAKAQGYYIITCDYLPENPGHKLADEYYNVSTTDQDAVLELSKKLKIDGIVAYASDPAAPTAAYVAEKMGLPGNPYESVLTLARKDLFRAFLKEHGFNVPRSESFYDLHEAKKWLEEISVPAFIKPVDSSGSKGVTEITSKEQLSTAFQYALNYSREKKVVVEEKIVKQGYQVAGDGFVIDGQLAFHSWADEHFDKLCNGLVPIGQTFPTSHDEKLLQEAHKETQRLLNLLNMKTGALNFDFLFSQDGKFYFLELGPRNGGCLIPEVIRYATEIDLIKATVDAALGLDCSYVKQTSVKGFWSSYMVHSLNMGKFESLNVSERVQDMIVESNMYVAESDQVNLYSGSNDTLGMMILQYPDMETMLDMVDNMEHDIRVRTIQ